jgi:hypothetical protein
MNSSRYFSTLWAKVSRTGTRKINSNTAAQRSQSKFLFPVWYIFTDGYRRYFHIVLEGLYEVAKDVIKMPALETHVTI